MAIKLQLRRDTTQNWYEINPILSEGEFGVEFLDNGKAKIKIGDGTRHYSELEYFADTISYLDLIEKPKINGIPVEGEMTLSELGIQPVGSYVTLEDLVNGLALKADIDNTYNKADIDKFFDELIKIPSIDGYDDKYLKLKNGVLVWSDIDNDIVTTKELNTSLAYKVDVKKDYSLMSDAEIYRLSSVHNYDDSAIKEDLDLLKDEVDTKASINQLERNYVSNNAFTETLSDYALKADISSKANASELNSHATNTFNPHKVTKAQVGLGNVDNTADINKPVSVATQTALNKKQDTLIEGHGISIVDNVITNTIPNVQSDWNAQEGDSMIFNKPVLSEVATSGSYNDLKDLPYIPNDYVLPVATSEVLGGIKLGAGFIKGEDGTISVHEAVNTYNELANKPSIGGIVLMEGQTAEDLDLATAKATQSELNLKADKDTVYTKEEIDDLFSETLYIPTKVSEFENDANYVNNEEFTNVTTEIATNLSSEIERANNSETIINEELNKKAYASDVYTKEEIDLMVSTLYVYKGSVATFDELPTENNSIGDIWNVSDEAKSYAWNGESWDNIGPTFDLTGYLTIENANTSFVHTNTTNNQVYTTNDEGMQSSIEYSETLKNSTIALRKEDGCLEVSLPTSQMDATNKEYVDSIREMILLENNGEPIQLEENKNYHVVIEDDITFILPEPSNKQLTNKIKMDVLCHSFNVIDWGTEYLKDENCNVNLNGGMYSVTYEYDNNIEKWILDISKKSLKCNFLHRKEYRIRPEGTDDGYFEINCHIAYSINDKKWNYSDSLYTYKDYIKLFSLPMVFKYDDMIVCISAAYTYDDVSNTRYKLHYTYDGNNWFYNDKFVLGYDEFNPSEKSLKISDICASDDKCMVVYRIFNSHSSGDVFKFSIYPLYKNGTLGTPYILPDNNKIELPSIINNLYTFFIGGTLYTSEDCINWKTYNTGKTNIKQFCYCNNKYIMVIENTSNNTYEFYYSTDLQSWTLIDLGYTVTDYCFATSDTDNLLIINTADGYYFGNSVNMINWNFIEQNVGLSSYDKLSCVDRIYYLEGKDYNDNTVTYQSNNITNWKQYVSENDWNEFSFEYID